MPQQVNPAYRARWCSLCHRVSRSELLAYGASIFNLGRLALVLVVVFNWTDTDPIAVQLTGSKVMSFHYNHLSINALSCVNTGISLSTTQRLRFTRISSPGFLGSGIGVSSSTQ